MPVNLWITSIAVAITIVVANCIRLRTILPKPLEFQRTTAGYSIPDFRRFATRLFANAIEQTKITTG